MQRRKLLKYAAMIGGTVKGRRFLANWLPSSEEAAPSTAGECPMPAPSPRADTDTRGPYQPIFFKPDEFETVEILTGIIIPTDEKPGAKEARVAEFIDFVVAGAAEFMPDLQQEWTKGLAWLDEESKRRSGQPFRRASSAEQIQLLTDMAAPERSPEASHPGFEFYRRVKEMTVEGFYSSRVGLLDVLEYKGLTYLSSFPGCTHPDHQSAS